MYTADSPEVRSFVAAFQRVKGYNYPLSTTTRRKYIQVERDHSAIFLIDKATGKVYNVLGFGKRGLQAGNLWNLTAAYETAERLAVVKG